MRALLLVVMLVIFPVVAAAGEEQWSPAERENYRHFQLNLIGHEPIAESFREGYAFIRPLHAAAPESEAYRICYAQAISGFPAGSDNAALHIAAVEALAPIPASEIAETQHLGILLLNLMERITEDGELLRDERRTPPVQLALRRADAVAAAIFAYSLERGTWAGTKPGSDDWSIRAGMPERRDRLVAPAHGAPAIPVGGPDPGGSDQQVVLGTDQPRTLWLPQALVAARDLRRVYADRSAFTPRSAP